jgi:hypothetical protein
MHLLQNVKEIQQKYENVMTQTVVSTLYWLSVFSPTYYHGINYHNGVFEKPLEN